MLLALASLCLGAALPQDLPRVTGAYRGPSDEVLQDQERAELLDRNPHAIPDGWERWEFWFEHERDLLLRGPAENPPTAVNPKGRYGHFGSALERATVIGRGLPLLHRALEDGRADVREAASLAIGRIAEPVSVGVLLEALEDPEPSVRQAALLGLGLGGHDRAIVTLADAFIGSPKAETRAFAALGLGLSGRSEAVELIRLYLNRNLYADRILGKEEEVVLAALWASGLFRSRAFSPALLRGAQELARSDSQASKRVRGWILHALGAIGDPDARGFLRAALRSGDASLERAAAQALGRCGAQADVTTLRERFEENGDLATRAWCLTAIGRIGGVAAEEALVAVRDRARRNRQTEAAWAIAAGLARSSTLIEEVQDSFLYATENAKRQDHLRRDEEQLRGAYAVALAFFGDARAVQGLQRVAATSGTDADLRGYSGFAIGYLDGPDSLPFLLEEAEEDLQRDAQRGVVLGLGLLADPRSTRKLTSLLLDDEDPAVRHAAARALAHHRSQEAFTTILDRLEAKGELRLPADHAAHAILALGYLGDVRRGASLGSLLAGLDYRHSSALLRAVEAY